MSATRLSVFGEDDAEMFARSRDPQNPGAVDLYVRMDPDSPIRGEFDVVAQVESELFHLEPRHRAQLATMFLEMQERGPLPSGITVEQIEQAKSRRPTAADRRAERILRYLHDATSEIGTPVELGSDDVATRHLCLYSESVGFDELRFLIRFLEQRGLVQVDVGNGWIQATVTVEGLSVVAEQMAAPDSSQAFVAMWFHDDLESLFRDGIAPGIEDAGYEPLRVDMRPTLHRIDDQIIAEIRRSRFMVADFTQGDNGARGSVYYEAGFAHGLDIPVIFTCRQDQLDDLHFDTRQYPHIGWTDPADLREALKYRIEALIGRGPASSG